MATKFLKRLLPLLLTLLWLSSHRMSAVQAPADSPVSITMGDVTVASYSPVTITPLENSTNLYFVATNRGTSPLTLQFLSYSEILSTKPSWLFAFFKFFGFEGGGGTTPDTPLAPGETRTLEFYVSKDMAGGNPLQTQLPFRFKVLETGLQDTLSITVIGDDTINDFNRQKSATITGRVTSDGVKPVANALVSVALFNENQMQSVRTDVNGNYRLDVLSIDDVRIAMGPRTFPYKSVAYFLTAEAPGYTLSYTGGISPATGQTVVANVTLQPVAQRVSYKKVGELPTDGTLSYWWIRFAGNNNDRVVAVEGQHPPVAPGPQHIIGVDLTGKELWRVPTGAQCWGLDVTKDGQLIAAGSDDGFVYMLTADGAIKWKVSIGDRPGGGFVEDVRFSPDGQSLIVDGGAGAGGFSVLNAQTGQIVWNSGPPALGESTQGDYKSRWSSDGARYVAGSDGPIALYTAAGKQLWRNNIGESPLWLEIDDAYNVYAAGKSRELFSYDQTGKLRWSYRLAHTSNEAWKGITADASQMVIPTFNGLLQTFDAAGRVLWQHFLPSQHITNPQGIEQDFIFGPGHNALSMTPSGDLIAVGTRGYQVCVYDRSGSLLWSHTASFRSDFKGDNPDTSGHYSGTNSVSISPDGKYIAAGYADSVIRIFKQDAMLGNLSTRLKVDTGDNALIGGFIVTGTQPKKIMIRGIGPSLTKFGVPGVLQDPQLELHNATGVIGTNDDWQITQVGGVVTSDEVSAIQNTGLAPNDSKESAIIATLDAANNAYTVILRGANNGTGVGLVEIYDLDNGVDSKLANISTRGSVQTDDNVMIGGFIVLGSLSQKVVIRGIGPSLGNLGVTGFLNDPTLELHDSNGALIATNDDWKTRADGTSQEADIQATGLAPTNDFESVISSTLSPGNYSAIVRGKNRSTGIALVEIYKVN